MNPLSSLDTSAITSALTTIASNSTEVINSVAPVGIGIFGIFMVWRLGIKMFKTLVGK